MEIRGVKHNIILFHAAWIGFTVYILLRAWVSEDAYITFRVIDNFVNGYGLRWNVNERVQVYTHPLWMLLQIPLRIIIPNIFMGSIVLSVVCTMAAIHITLATAQKPLPIILGCFFLPMLLSKAFTDYTTSGLENPMCYLLFAAFGYVILRKYDHPHFWFYCSALIALSLFNRLDTVLLYTPTLAWLAWTHFRQIRWKQIALGALPLATWLGFSLFYYGFFFPNTKYAKLDTNIDGMIYIKQGLYYARYTLVMDTASALAIVSSLVFIINGMRQNPPVFNELRMFPQLRLFPMCIALGVWWYVLYIINIGGDYMLGRFWALPVFVSIWLAYIFTPVNINPKILYGILAVFALVSIPSPVLKAIRRNCNACVIRNERMMIDARFMFGGNKLVVNWKPFRLNFEAHHRFVDFGNTLKKTRKPPYAEKAHFIGMLGYYAGPGIDLIDEFALADPLLARLPVARGQGFYTGHFRRTIPQGYIDAHLTGDTDEMDTSLGKYYEKLRLVTSGDLLDPERLKTIVAFNLGTYDEWKYEYLYCSVW